VYYTNRALCHLRLDAYDKALVDAQKAAELDPGLVKAHYLSGLALTHVSETCADAVAVLDKAYRLALAQKSAATHDIVKALMAARKKQWLVQNRKKETAENALRLRLRALVGRDPESESLLGQVDALFDARQQSRLVPDYLCDKLSFELMHDPVIAPSGISYERKELLQHFKMVGHFDPFTREPLQERDLVPNLALREVLDDYIKHNGWALDE
jgi:STIP1 family protein 1